MNARPDEATLKRARELLHARYRAGDIAGVSAWNDVLATLLSHRSVRAYQSTPLPEGTLELIVAAARDAGVRPVHRIC